MFILAQYLLNTTRCTAPTQTTPPSTCTPKALDYKSPTLNIYHIYYGDYDLNSTIAVDNFANSLGSSNYWATTKKYYKDSVTGRDYALSVPKVIQSYTVSSNSILVSFNASKVYNRTTTSFESIVKDFIYSQQSGQFDVNGVYVIIPNRYMDFGLCDTKCGVVGHLTWTPVIHLIMLLLLILCFA